MSPSKWEQRCDYLRAIPLETLLTDWGAKRDQKDPCKWQCARGTITIRGSKFFNWKYSCGGGGAIDLTMHLKQCHFQQAVKYLQTIQPGKSIPVSPSSTRKDHKRLILPVKDDSKIPRIARYLVNQRKLPNRLVGNAIKSQRIYADCYANAIFLMKGRNNTIVGAELRGTTAARWRGLASGTDKQKGAFYVGDNTSNIIAICESAIDALSYSCLFPGHLAVSCAGANPFPRWIVNFISREYTVLCAFDDDPVGNEMANRMKTRFPQVIRMKPNKHDWNDMLKNK